MTPVGRRIKEAQAEKGLTNEQLADALQVSLRLVMKWRAGDVTPGFPNMKRLERVLGKPVAWFFSEDGAEAA